MLRFFTECCHLGFLHPSVPNCLSGLAIFFPLTRNIFVLTEKQTNDLSIGMQQKNFHYLEGALGVEPRDVFRRPTHLCGLAGLDLKIDLLVADVRPKLDSLQRDLEF